MNVFRTCDECGVSFEVDESIAREMDMWKEQAGDPYVCGPCEHGGDPMGHGDVEDSIDAMAERFPNGEDPMLRNVIRAQCQKCNLEFEIYVGQTVWCPECHIHKNPARPPAEILEDVDIQVEKKYVILSGSIRIHLHGRERPFLFMHLFQLGEKAAAKKVIQFFSEGQAKPNRLRLYFNTHGLISDVEDITHEKSRPGQDVTLPPPMEK